MGRPNPDWAVHSRMNIAVTAELGQAEPVAEGLPASRSLARVEIFDALEASEPCWRALERRAAWATPYQRYDLLAAWQQHVGTRKGVVPCVVVGYAGDGEPLFLWPFGRKRMGPVTIAGFLGSKHACFNVGLWRRDFVGAVRQADIRAAFARMAGGDGGVDLVVLLSQPLGWAGIANPFAFLRQQASAEDSTFLSLAARGSDQSGDRQGLSPQMESRLRIKEKKLSKLADYRYIEASSAPDIDRLLDAFLALKAVHMTRQGLPNVFAEPGVAEFLREACHARRPGGQPLIEIHALEGGGEVLALYGAIADDHRFSAMFNTYTLSDNARHSPGLILARHMLAAAVERGLRGFDLGVGRAHYKSFFCKEPEPLFDTFLPLTPRGSVAAPAFRAIFAAKRMIKSKPALWAGVQFFRRFRAG
jgi:CelD/BcsL family acetyltransferase involved in cellulose biosynthesis